MEYSAEERAIIWLNALEPFDYRERVALLRAARDPARLLSEWEKISVSVIKEEKRRVYNSDRVSREREADALVAELAEKEYFAVTLASDGYPDPLKAVPDPPLVLYGAGRRELLKARKLCIVGSRITPPWAEKQGKFLSEALSAHFAVVTGLAEGGDCAAIAGALPGGNLICILPNGLDCCYPAAHASLKERVKKAGLLLSEYPPAQPLKKYFFHARNRILAGLSEGVLVLSAGERSGALITANCAADYGRDVFALPYNAGSAQGAGCNGLIKKGAYLVTEAQDILSCYGIEGEERARVALTAEEARVLAVLREGGELHSAVVAQRAGMQVFEAAAALSSLELKNLAVKAGGNRYTAL